MEAVSVNKFRERLKDYTEKVIDDHEPLKVTRREGRDFVVISFADWQQQEETIYVLQNQSLMRQIVASNKSYVKKIGHKPTKGELNEIVNL